MEVKSPSHLHLSANMNPDTSEQTPNSPPHHMHPHNQQFRNQHQQHQHQQQHQQQQPIQHLINRRGSSGSAQSRTCKTEGHGVSATACANCGTTTTPLWRRAPNGETICNACGLYLKARNTVRPPWLKRNAIKKAAPTVPETSESNNNNGTCPGDGHCDGTGGSSSCDGCPAYNQHQVNRQALICANCGTNTTPLWRRDEAGNTICNACGLYFKLHNVHRPVTMKRSVIKRRKRVALTISPPQTQSSGPDNEHQSGKTRVHHPPTPTSISGSERGYISSDDDTCSIENLNFGRKRKADDTMANNKRLCGGGRQVPPIEDYIIPSKRSGTRHGDRMWSNDDRRRSLSPVEPSLSTGLPQVQIHQNNTGAYNSSHLMGTPSVPLPSVFHKDGDYSPRIGPINFGSTQAPSSSISALLNPSSPQLPPISTIPSSNVSSSHMGLSLSGQSHTDPNITQQVLHAHRQELQREVSHLSMLLNRTTAILVGLDQAMASNAAARAANLDVYGSSDNNGGAHCNGQTSYGLPSPPINAGMSQKSYMNVTLPPLSPPADGQASH